MQHTHDFLQWKFLSEILKTENVAVVDTYRIPKSPKYMGTGPRPLKLTLLRSEMLNVVKVQWQRYQNQLPRDLRISSSTRKNKSPDAAQADAKELVEQCEPRVASKNDQSPTSPESAQL